MNPFSKAIMKIQGKSVVDNETDPASALNRVKRASANLSQGNGQADAMSRALGRVGKSKGIQLGVGLSKSK